MLDTLFIFGAEKLFLLSPLIALALFYKAGREKKIEILIFGFFSLPLTYIFAFVAKSVYYNPLPFVIRGFEPLISHAPNNGFPSDHVLLLASIASVFVFFDKKRSLLLWSVALIVGVSRVYVGVHHTVDIVASAVIAVVAGLIVEAVLRWRKSV